MSENLRSSLILSVLVSLPALTDAAELEEIIVGGSIDLFVTVAEADVPEDWFAQEAEDPSPRPVLQERFVNLREGVYEAWEPPVETPVEFRMFFMDGVEERVIFDSVEDVERGEVTLRRLKGRVKHDKRSRINLILTEEQIRGTVHYDESVIELRSVRDDISVIQVLDKRQFPKEQNPKPAHRQAGFVKKEPLTFSLLVGAGADFTSAEVYDGIPLEDDSYEPPEIGILVVRTEDAFNCDDLSLEGTAQDFQDALDDAFVGYATTRVEAVCTPNPEDWASIEAARQYVMTDDDVKQWRKDADADLVIYLVNDGKGSCGFTMYPDYPLYPIEDYVDQYAYNAAFAVVEDGCALGQHSLQHEVGHLLGMKHERFNELGGVNDYCGYGYPVMTGSEPVAITIMAYDDYCDYMGVSCDREPYYSVPRKKATGFWGWLKNLWHKCFGKTKGITCASTTPGHLNRPANDLMQLIDAAPHVATYSEQPPPP
jgi:hypothetical protein